MPADPDEALRVLDETLGKGIAGVSSHRCGRRSISEMALWHIQPDSDRYRCADVVGLSPSQVLDLADVLRSGRPVGEKGKIMRVVSCAFREEMLSNVHIFRIPEEAGSRLSVDDSFKQAVQAAHLEVPAFYEVPLAAP